MLVNISCIDLNEDIMLVNIGQVDLNIENTIFAAIVYMPI